MSNLIKNITGRIVLLITVALLLLSGYFLYISYNENINQAEKDTLERLHSISRTLALQLDGDKLSMLMGMFPEKDAIQSSDQNDYYQQIHRKLKEAAKLNDLPSPIYTLTYDSSQQHFYFGITSAKEPYFRHTYTSAPTELKQNYTSGGTIPAFEDEHGTWLSAFSPIRDDQGNVVGILMVDQPFDRFIQEAQMKLLRDAGITISIFLIVGIFLLKAIRKILKEEEQYKRDLENSNRIIEEKNQELYKLSLVASKTDNIILLLSPDGTIEWVNDHYERMIGYTLEELKKEKGPTIYESSNSPHIKEYIDTAIREKRSVIYESFNQTRQGEQYWASTTLTPIFGDNGELHHLIIVDANIHQLKQAENEIRQKSQQLEEKNQEITSSIDYASKIQASVLPDKKNVEVLFKDAFVLYEPKDIVSGDLYWAAKLNTDEVIVAAIDCTGHGVPGAMMSVIAHSAMNEIVLEEKVYTPGRILGRLNTKVIELLRQNEEHSETADGMDMVLCRVNKQERKVHFAGANRPLLMIRNGTIDAIRGDRFPIGSAQYALDREFTDHEVQLGEDDLIYLSSDGYPDQFGGPRDKKFTMKKLKHLLVECHERPLQEQYDVLMKAFLEWKGDQEQIDDVTLLGIRL